MDYKTILVHADGDPAADGRMELAMSVARMFKAAVFGVAAETWYPVAVLPEYGFVPSGVIEEIERGSRQRLDAAQRRFRALADEAELEALSATEVDFPGNALAWHARSADLIVASRIKPPYADGRVVLPSELVISAGLPVLVKADSASTITAEHVVIGWKNTRECRRALTEAMPFLKQASRVTLAQAVQESELEAARADLAAVAGRLLRHGVAAETEVVPGHGGPGHGDVREALEALALRRGADLLVLGAYGHARWRETVFGGVTKGFLQRSALHVLFSS